MKVFSVRLRDPELIAAVDEHLRNSDNMAADKRRLIRAGLDLLDAPNQQSIDLGGIREVFEAVLDQRMFEKREVIEQIEETVEITDFVNDVLG